MDTLLKKKEYLFNVRTCEYVLIVSLSTILFLAYLMIQTPIFANDKLLANSNIATPTLINFGNKIKEEISPTYRKEQFESRIKNKYIGQKINNISDGIKHIAITKTYNGKPVRINIVEINNKIAQNYEIKPVIASKTLANKRKLTKIANDTNSIVAINGGFFKPETGVPLGTLMIDKKLYTGPIYNRVAFGIFENEYRTERIQLDAKIITKDETIKIDNINQPRMLSSYIIAYTKDWGNYAPASPQYGVQIQIIGNKIAKVSTNPLFIPENGYVIVGPKSKLNNIINSQDIDIIISTNPKWENVKHIISGGPYLVKDNQIFIDMTAQKLQSIGGRNPRTAIGYTQNNDLILVTADGREGSSIGLTLKELANLMKELGCINAINLDGGGSTTMYINGQIVNRPKVKGGISLSNALVISKKNSI